MLIILALVNLSKCCCLDLLLSERGCLPGICVSGVGRCRLCSVSPHNLDMLQTAQSVTPKPGHVANCAVCHPTIWTCCKLCSLSPHNLDMLQTVQSVTPQSGHVADCAVCHAKIWTCYKLCSLSPQNLDMLQTVQSVTPKSLTGLQTVQSVTPIYGQVYKLCSLSPRNVDMWDVALCIVAQDLSNINWGLLNPGAWCVYLSTDSSAKYKLSEH